MDSVEWLGLGSNCAFAKSHILKRFCSALLFTSSTCQKSGDFTVWEYAIRESQPADLRFFFSAKKLGSNVWRDVLYLQQKLHHSTLWSAAFLAIVKFG